jgi:transcriptional regulator with XRE-family HTH domain
MTPCESLRRGRRWSQEQLAVYAGLGLSTVRRLEDGGEVRLSSLRKIAKALDTDPLSLQPNLASKVS